MTSCFKKLVQAQITLHISLNFLQKAMVQYTIVIFIESLSVFTNINKKLVYPLKLISALLAKNRQKSTLKDEKTSIIFTVTGNISASHTRSNLL